MRYQQVEELPGFRSAFTVPQNLELRRGRKIASDPPAPRKEEPAPPTDPSPTADTNAG